MSEDYIGGTGLASEEMPSLADFAEEPGGRWPNGWYAGTIVEGYATQRGKQFTTTEEVSKNGTSRNLFLCIALNSGAGRADKEGNAVAANQTRNLRETVNYRVDDFTPERLTQIKELREEFKGQQGAWPGQGDAQRSSLAVAKLGQIEKAVGFKLKRSPAGLLVPNVFVGQRVDVRLGTDDKGFNTVTAFAQAGTKTAR